MPAELRALAEAETLEYLLEDWDGIVVPVITTAFWHNGVSFGAADPWDDFWRHGGGIQEIPISPADEVWECWREDFGLEGELLTLAQDIFAQRIAVPEGRIVLSDRERAVLVAVGAEEGLAESREAFVEIGIELP